jgi:photosystem II stability/assembly factor-like uncharacterized protein
LGNYASIFFVDANNGYAVGSETWMNGCKLIKTENAGSTWTVISPVTGNALNSVHFPDANTGYAVGQWGTILKTPDAGVHWSVLPSGTSMHLLSVYFVSPEVGYITGASGTILKTTDGGETWTKQISGITQFIYSVHFLDASNGYAVAGWPSKVLKTTSGGETWTLMAAWTGSDFLNSIHFIDSNLGFAVGGIYQNSGVIRKTIDGGITWTTTLLGGTDSHNSANYFNSVRFADANVGYAVGTSGIIFKTIDSGDTWIQQPSGTNVNLSSVYLTKNNNVFAAGARSVIIKSTFEGSNGVTESLLNSGHLNIYPNPANDFVNIDLPELAGENRVSLFNIEGQKLLEQSLSQQKTKITIHNLPAGIYVIRVINGNNIATKKLVKE